MHDNVYDLVKQKDCIRTPWYLTLIRSDLWPVWIRQNMMKSLLAKFPFNCKETLSDESSYIWLFVREGFCWLQTWQNPLCFALFILLMSAYFPIGWLVERCLLLTVFRVEDANCDYIDVIFTVEMVYKTRTRSKTTYFRARVAQRSKSNSGIFQQVSWRYFSC